MSISTPEWAYHERIDRLAEWAGWTRGLFRHWYDKTGRLVAEEDWNPFTSLDASRLLLLEWDRRHLMWRVACSVAGDTALRSRAENLLLASAKQITEAVEMAVGFLYGD